jgi:hypothetical protein
MKFYRRLAGALLAGVSALVWGCPSEDFPSQLTVTMRDIDRVVADQDLSSQEKRTALGSFGLDPVTINGLLQADRLGNQFGGDLRTAYAKVTTPDLAALTPDEIQVWGDEASELDPNDDLSVSLTDAEAQAMAILLDAENLRTPAELKDYLDDPATSVPSTIPDGVLRSLFVDFEPDRLLPKLP